MEGELTVKPCSDIAVGRLRQVILVATCGKAGKARSAFWRRK